MVPLDEETAIRAALLPPIHADPCDRFIIALAMRLNTEIVTADDRFASYGVKVFF